MKPLLLIALILSALFTISCNKDDLRSEIPAYLKIDSASVSTNLTLQGSASHKITTVWVEANGKSIGVFELPAVIPVLASGSVKIRLDAGINENGMQSTRSVYPFYAPFEKTFELNPLDTTLIASTNSNHPVFTYSEFGEVRVVENFEGIGLNLQVSSRSDTIVYRSQLPEHLFQWPGETNNFSGIGYLADADMLFEVNSETGFQIPRNQPVYLELDYKTEAPIAVGLIINSANVGIVQAATVRINPNNSWNKIYINLFADVNGYPNVIDYKVFLGAINTEGQGPKQILFDNLKLVY